MKKGRFSKIIVATVIVLNIVFSAAVLYVFMKTNLEPVSLIGSWFAFTTMELLSVASIKKNKDKK
ncbi:MAG: hypothetical protein RR806_06400 [Oscillospiraceae bacterium]